MKMQSKATTVKEYLASLPEDRRKALTALRKVFLENLDKTFTEGMSYGMMGYSVPHSVYPPGYHCDPKQPLPFAGMASQKNHMSLYLMCLYFGGSPASAPQVREYAQWFAQAWKASGKKLDMGKSCIRFKTLEDLPLDVIGEAIRRVPADMYIKQYEALLATHVSKKPAAAKAKPAKKAARKTVKKPAKPTKKAKKRK